MTGQPLHGIDVLDLGQLYNGPYCSLILSYLGADVVKVEPPSGELLRSRVEEGEPPELVMMNSSKRGITLNLKSDDGRDLFTDLVAESDVLVENFAADTMEGLGLGYDTLSEINPGLVYAHGSGFGERGPYRKYPAMDLTIQALGGVMDVTGFPDQPPVKTGIAVADFLGGIHLATGVVSALFRRERTGEGDFVEVSMHDTVYPTLASPLASHFHGEDTLARTGNRHSGLAHCPYNVYETADGYIAVFCVSDEHWVRLTEALDRPDLAADPRFDTNVDRTAHMDEIDAEIEGETRQYERDALAARLREADVPCGPVKSLEEVADDPHLRERGMIHKLDHPDYDGEIGVPGQPIRLAGAPGPEITPSPTRGEHNADILGDWLGLTEAEVERLEDEGAL